MSKNVSADAAALRAHLPDRLMQVFARERSLYVSHRGLKQSEIADTARPTKRCELHLMEAKHLIESEELQFHSLAQTFEQAGVLCEHFPGGLAEKTLARRVPDGRHHK